jgi:hypothetical protein
MPRVTLLGPQQPIPSLISAVDGLGYRGRIAAITAGWEERELEDDELRAHLRGQSFNLRLWERAEEVFARDPEFLAGLRARKERVVRLQELYRLRLGHANEALRELMERHGLEEDLDAERDDAMETIRRLDAHQLERVTEVNHWFDERYRPAEREAIVRHRRAIARKVEDADALAIAGGHVGVLLTRLRIFGIADLLRTKPVIAWSAGTMALAPRIVLFHDNPPQGRGNAEVFEPGLATYHGIVPLPRARQRLRLDDPARVTRLARRFAPALCVPLDPFDRIDIDDGKVTFAPRCRRLEIDGRVAAGAKP